MKKKIIIVLSLILILTFAGVAWGDNITKKAIERNQNVENVQLEVEEETVLQESPFGTEDPFENNDILQEESGMPDIEYPPIPGAMGEVRVISTNPNDFKDSYAIEQKVLEANSEIVDKISDNNEYILLLDDDLALGVDNNFWVGVNKFSDFSDKYGVWQKSNSPSQFPGKSEADFYGEVDENGYPYSTIIVEYSQKTNIVKEIFFTQQKHLQGELMFKTYRDISIGSTIDQVIKAYGTTYTANIVHNPNKELCNYVYKFETKSGFKGILEFYGSFNKGQLVGNARVDGIRLSVE